METFWIYKIFEVSIIFNMLISRFLLLERDMNCYQEQVFN